MSKKRLPKAITRNAAELTREGAEQTSATPGEASSDQSEVAASGRSDRPSPTSGEPESPRLEPPFTPPVFIDQTQQESSKAAALVPPVSSGRHAMERPVTAVATLPAEGRADSVTKRAQAQRIVNRYAGYSALGGMIPMVLIDIVGITAITMQMVRTLSRHYGVPFERTQTRALVTGMLGGAASPGLATLSTSTFLHFVPGANLLALAISSATAAASVRSLGEVFIEEFEQISEGRTRG